MSASASPSPAAWKGVGSEQGEGGWWEGGRGGGGAGPQIPGGVLCTHALSRLAVFAQQGASRPGGEGGRPAPAGVPQLQSLPSLRAMGVSKLFRVLL